MGFKEVELFRGLSPDVAQQLVALGTTERVPSGAELFSLGAPADQVFIVQRGRIDLTLPMHVRDREEDVLIEERSPGQAFGWSALIPPHRFTLKAMAPLDTEVLAIPRAALVDYFAAHPIVAYIVTRNVAEVVSGRLQVFQAMWLREMQRGLELRSQPARGTV